VFIFAAVGTIAASVYLVGQTVSSRQRLGAPAAQQALLNARSGIWYALDLLYDTLAADTLPTVNPLDTLFGKELFGSASGAPVEPAGDRKLSPDGTPRELVPYTSDEFGFCEIALHFTGAFKQVVSRGFFSVQERAVEALIGGEAVVSAETLLYLPDAATPVGNLLPSVRIGTFNVAKEINNGQLQELIGYYVSQLTYDSSAGLFEAPLVIQNQAALEKLSETVEGPLLVDGMFWDLVWKADKSYRILGDLQLTGKVRVERCDFLVAGDIKVLDDVTMKNVTMFATGQIFIGDRAVFSGDAMALSKMTVYGNARAENRSTLIVAGRKSGGPPKTDRKETKKGGTIADHFGILLSESAVVDGVVMALQSPGGIKVDEDVLVTGVLFAQRLLCLRGTVAGVVKAGLPRDCSDPDFMKNPASIPGTLKSLPSIRQYRFPCILGKPAIISWKED